MVWDFLFSRVFVKSVEVVHVFSWASWIAGLLYLPRIFVYHSGVSASSEADQLFGTMERRLYRYIMTPAMVMTVITGASLSYLVGAWGQTWFHVKLGLVLAMLGTHFTFGYYRRAFTVRIEKNTRLFRIMNEIPAVILLGILVMVIIKPYR